jgi:hypothetical protein
VVVGGHLLSEEPKTVEQDTENYSKDDGAGVFGLSARYEFLKKDVIFDSCVEVHSHDGWVGISGCLRCFVGRGTSGTSGCGGGRRRRRGRGKTAGTVLG